MHEVVAAPGHPLDAGALHEMQARFGHDFSRVRVHDDAVAARSAAAVGARAYTAGDHVVLGAGPHPGDGREARRLLAHELAHVVQQRRTPAGAEPEPARSEAEADAAARVAAGGGQVPSLTAAAPALARDGAPGGQPSDAAARADAAEATCDIATLCNLSFRAPDVVRPARVLRVFTACHPGVSPVGLIAGNPCLTPNFGLPAAAGPARGGPGAPTAGPQPAQSGGSAGGLTLPSTTIRFSLGPAAFTVDLPASLAVRLPVAFRGGSLVISLNASPDEFSFSVTVNAVRHVRIIASAAATTSGRGSAGLTLETTRTTCRAVDAESGRRQLQAAGERLRDAILAVQTPPPLPADAGELRETFDPHIRLGEVAAAVANVHSTIERVRSRCREVPVASLRFGVEGPLTTPEPGTQPSPTFIGGSLRLHF